MNVFICGQGPAAEKILRIHHDRFERVCLFTYRESSIFELARNLRISTRLTSVNEVEYWPFEPDLIISIYYRTIIKQHVIDRVKGRIFNAHVSLLPRNRGRSPIPWAIVEGDQFTGVTYHYIDAGVDTGPIILQAVCQISDNETQLSLFEKVNGLTVAYFPAALALVEAGVEGVPQRGEATMHKAGPTFSGVISDWWTTRYTERFIRAMTYPPLPYATYNGKEIKSLDDYRAVRYEQSQNSHRVTI